MIKVEHATKTYYKSTKHPIHVLTDVSLNFESRGLVMLLGPSGSGKTTLLNVLGGLDKLDHGVIHIENETLKRYQANRWDAIRRQNIGTIFQNYVLLNDETVYENLDLVIRMQGIKDEEMRKEKIQSLLKTVGLENYENRLAADLSGGQQQRVAIARALAKSPKVLLADEPTGNLDSKNTFEIMRILHTIAKERLVIMVTHEEDLARAYATRIIRLYRGRIVEDSAHTPSARYKVFEDQEIYLKSLTKKELHVEDNVQIDYYQDIAPKEHINARFIFKNETLYIDVDPRYKNQTKLIDKQSDVIIKDEVAPKEKDQATPLSDFTFDEAKNTPLKHGVIDFAYAFKIAKKKLTLASKRSKLLYTVFALGASVIALAIAAIANVLIINEDQIVNTPKEAIMVYSQSVINYESFEALVDHELVIASNVFEEGISLQFQLPTFYQSSNTQPVRAHASPLTLIEPEAIIYGRYPEKAHEIVIDIALANRMLNSAQFETRGITSYEALLNLVNRQTFFTDHWVDYEIVGLSDTKMPVYYLSDAFITSFAEPTALALELFDEDELVTVAGRKPVGLQEVMRSVEGYYGDVENFTPFTETLGGRVYEVVGLYEYYHEDTRVRTTKRVLTSEAIKAYLVNTPTDTNRGYYLYTNDAKALGEYLTQEEILYSYPFATELDIERMERSDTSQGIIVFTIIGFLASGISFYFVIRSSMIARIYDISVYRALAISKRDVTKIFMIESFMITTISAAIGYVSMSILLYVVEVNIHEALGLFKITPLTFTLGLLIIYLINTLSGLIPIRRLLSQTPAEIAVRYDV